MENVNNKNKKLTIIVGALLLVVGISFAYFIATTLINGKGSSVVGTTARIKGAEINIEGTLEFNDLDVLPGHKNVSAIKVTATGNNQLIPYNLIWKGESGISQINYTVYKSATSLNVTTNCTKKTGVQNGMQVLSEECTITNIDTLGEAIANGSISKGDTREILAQDEFITALNNGSTVYYYVVLEYPNLDEDQSNDANATFNGEVTVEESNKEADINILAVYVADENGNYQETTDIPQSGYALNSDRSTCSNGARPGWDIGNSRFYADNLTKSGTSCYLYFDEELPPAETMLARLNITNFRTQTSEMPNFAVIATGAENSDTNNGLFRVADPLYGGNTYYWRGAATTNHILFADYCWRIVRINGDGTIRLIYNGLSTDGKCYGNEMNESSVIMGATDAERNYSTTDGRFNNSSYVGWTYTLNSQRPTDGGTASNAKVQTDKWYSSNITLKGFDGKVAIGKFCNDRRTKDNETWRATGNEQDYQGYVRSQTLIPSIDCDSEDIYNLKVGAITSDEVIMAGGKSEDNTSYYLYNGQSYWTMTPGKLMSSNSAYVFGVNSSGYLTIANGNVLGLRPVINLRSDVTISSGNGTLDTPFVVAD